MNHLGTYFPYFILLFLKWIYVFTNSFFLQLRANLKHIWSPIDSIDVRLKHWRPLENSSYVLYLFLRTSFVKVFWVLSKSSMFYVVSPPCQPMADC